MAFQILLFVAIRNWNNLAYNIHMDCAFSKTTGILIFNFNMH